MSADSAGGEPARPPLARWRREAEVVDGRWSRNGHWPFPVTPLWADFEIGRHITLGFQRGDREFAEPAAALDREGWRLIDGWVYSGSPGPAPAPSLERLAAFEARLLSGHDRAVVRRWHAETRPAFVTTVDGLRRRDLSALSDAGLRAHIEEVSDGLLAWWSAHFINLWAAAIAIGRWALRCREWFALEDAAIARLLAGSSAATAGPGALMAAIAAEVARDPALLAALETPAPWAHPSVRAALAPYFDAYGDRALEFEYARPTVAERPRLAVELLRSMLPIVRGGTPAVSGPATAGGATALGALGGRLPDAGSRAEWEWLSLEAREAYALREDDVSFVSVGHGLMRRALLEAGARLAGRSLLPDRDHVFFLRRDELEDALTGGPAVDLGRRTPHRRAEWRRRHTERPPERLGTPAPSASWPLSPAAQRVVDGASWCFSRQGVVGSVPEAGGRELRGIAAAPGSYRGPARVVRDEADFDRVESGDVLVCPTTNPAWTVLFPTVGAIVAEGGGVLSHPAIAAREFGIPAVVGARGALASLVDNMLVEVDGATGTVRW